MFKRNELAVATCSGTGSAICDAAIIPTNLRRYILHWEAHMVSAAIGTTRVILSQYAGTGAPVGSMQLDWFNFSARAQQAWRPDEWKEDSLPIAILEASCHTLIRSDQSHSFRAKVLYAEGA